MRKIWIVFCAVLTLAACNCSGDGKPAADVPAPTPEEPVPAEPTPSEEEPDAPAGPTRYRLGTYNVGVFSKSGADMTEMVVAMMKEIGVQALSMNELDYYNGRHNADQLGVFASKMGGWTYHFAPAINYKNGQYGIGIAAHPDLPVVKKTQLTLDKGDGSEQRALAVIEFQPFVFASTHLDHKSADAQLAQARKIDAWVAQNYGSGDKPVILCGDFNALPTSATIRFMQENWTILSPLEPTYSATNPTKCIDYIMVYKNAADKVKLEEAKVLTTFASGDVKVASDHLPVYVDISL